MFEILYTNHNTEIAKLLGKQYNPKKEFTHCEDVKIATLKGQGDGQDVEIYESRVPARFFKIKALDTPNSVGKINEGFVLSTGSSADKLAYDIATAISKGMLDLNSK